jgi:hypothetical protein
MARKNIQDDGSYQKKQIGKAKGRFDKKEEELEPPIKAQMFYDNENPSYGVGYQPLDANGEPVFGMKAFRGEAAEMLSKANRKKAFEKEDYIDFEGSRGGLNKEAQKIGADEPVGKVESYSLRHLKKRMKKEKK